MVVSWSIVAFLHSGTHTYKVYRVIICPYNNNHISNVAVQVNVKSRM